MAGERRSKRIAAKACTGSAAAFEAAPLPKRRLKHIAEGDEKPGDMGSGPEGRPAKKKRTEARTQDRKSSATPPQGGDRGIPSPSGRNTEGQSEPIVSGAGAPPEQKQLGERAAGGGHRPSDGETEDTEDGGARPHIGKVNEDLIRFLGENFEGNFGGLENDRATNGRASQGQSQKDEDPEPESAENDQAGTRNRLTLKTIDPALAREIGLDNTTGNPCETLREEIRNVAQMEDNTAAKSTLTKLIERYGAGVIWDRSWPIEVYSTQPLDFDGRWDVWEDDTMTNLRQVWLVAYIDVIDQSPSAEDIAVFIDAYLKAKYLARAGISVEPLAKANTDIDPTSYARHTHVAVVKEQIKHFREEQQKAHEGIEKRFGRTVREEFDAICNETRTEWIQDETPGNLELHPILSTVNWTSMQDIFKTWSPTTEQQVAFEEFMYLVETIIDRYETFMPPPADLAGLTCVTFLEHMQKEIADSYEVYRDAALKLWTDTLKMPENAPRKAELLKRFVLSYKHTKLGGWPTSYKYIMTNDENVDARNKHYWSRKWDTEIRICEVLQRSEEAKRFRRLQVQMLADTSTPEGPFPYGPRTGWYSAAWEEILRRAEKENASCVTIGRLNDLHARGDKLLQLSGMITLPLDWPEEMSADEYTGAAIHHYVPQLQSQYKLYWKDMKKVSTVDSDAWDIMYRRMINNVSLGQDFYGPPPMEEEYVGDRGPQLAKLLDVKGGDRSGLEGRWNFRGTLGAGAFGHVGYWERVDNNRDVMDRIAVKETYLRDNWDNELYWDGENDLRRPREFLFAEYLAGLPESDNIVKPRTYAIYDTLRMHRIYMEYCEHGTMKEMLKSYIKEDIVATDGSELRAEIPIRLLWSAFEAMASALCLMQDGTLPGIPIEGGPTYPGIIHRDLKPDNIFLAGPSARSWDGIPTFKIGDFGLAVQAADLVNERIIQGGTVGFMPPESYSRLEGDIWTVGKIMLDLMNRQGRFRIEDATHNLNRSALEPEGGRQFPAAMRDLVRECLQSEAVDRPSCEELWRSIHAEVAVGAGLSGHSLRSMKMNPADGELILIKRGLYDRFV